MAKGRKFPYCYAVALALVIACNQDTSYTKAPDSNSAPPASKPSRVQANAEPSPNPIPADVSYTIIEKDIVPGIKRSLTLRLNHRVSEDVLKAIALKLKNADSQHYDRTFISYYLPGMTVNSGAWATTHFNPNLEVRILGLTLDQEEALVPATTDVTRKTEGTWIDDSPGSSSVLTIYQKDGHTFLETKFKDGSIGTDELVETPSQHGKRFDFKPDRGHGEYYLINESGDLQELDGDGLFSTAQKAN